MNQHNTRPQVVSDEYGFEHVLHINTETGGTVHKHAKKNEEFCPYCNDDIDYGMGIDLSGAN